MELSVLAGSAFVATFCLVAITRLWAVRRGLFDIPCARSAHSRPTPRLGGLPIAIVIAVFLSVAPLGATSPDSIHGLVLASLLVMAVGLIDDLHPLSAAPRLLVHFIAGGLTVWLIGPLRIVGLDGALIDLGQLSVPLTILWIAAFINIFNFMDGIDGLAGVQTVVTGVTWISIGVLSNAGDALPFGALLAATGFGFLIHNWAPARIFMGDCGATVLGYWLGVLPLLAAEPWQSSCGLLALWPLVFDTAATLVQRLQAGDVLTRGHKRHFYQRLVNAGWTHTSVTVLYGVWSAACAAAALIDVVELILATTLGGAATVAALVAWRERAQHDIAGRAAVINADRL